HHDKDPRMTVHRKTWGTRISELGGGTALRGARPAPRDPEGSAGSRAIVDGPAEAAVPATATNVNGDFAGAAGEGIQLGGGQVDQAGRVLGQLGPLGGAEAGAEVLVLPRADDLLHRHRSLLSRTREGHGPCRVHLPPLMVAPDAGGGGDPASGVSG